MNSGILYYAIRFLAFFKHVKIAFEKHFLLKVIKMQYTNRLYLIVYKGYLYFRRKVNDHEKAYPNV
jgi:hypothetical protein